METIKPSALTQRDYQNAIYSQMACNLVAIVNSLADVLNRIKEDNPDSESINRHPIVRLYVEQLVHLSGSGITTNNESYSKAYNEVWEKASGGRTIMEFKSLE